MDEVRNLLGEYFFGAGQERIDDGKQEEPPMKYKRQFNSIDDFEREELHTGKVEWSIDDFFDEVFLSGDLDFEFDAQGKDAGADADDDEDEE